MANDKEKIEEQVEEMAEELEDLEEDQNFEEMVNKLAGFAKNMSEKN